MWSWIYSLAHWLPVWYVTLGIAVGAVIIPLLWKSLGHALNEDEDVAAFILPMVLITIGGGVFVVTSSGWWALPIGWATLYAVDGIIWLARKAIKWGSRAWAWCKAKVMELRAKRERDPKRILAYCKRQVAEANRRRVPTTAEALSNEKLDSVEHFNQGCSNLLVFLEQLYKLDAHMEELEQMASEHKSLEEGLFEDVSPDYLQDFGLPGGMDLVSRKAMRKQVHVVIAKTVKIFKHLPRFVADLNIREEAVQIKGMQKALDTLSPKESSADGLIAELETNVLQAKLVEELTAKPVATVPHAVEAPNVRQFASGGGGVRTKK